jgi:phosphate transport system permease protein
VSAVLDPTGPLTPTGNLRRRQFVSRVFEILTVAAAGLAVVVLGILVYYVCTQGVAAISAGFFTSGELPSYNGIGGGILPALIGTIELATIATLIALPIGLLTALYLTQFAGPRANNALRLMIDLMAGLPTIIIGVFIAGLITNRFGQSALAGGVALSIVMLPLISRASLEAISRVPTTLIDAADALGVARWRTIAGVILPTASNGIVTATILAVARAAGETAPILFTCSLFTQNISINPLQPVASIPVEIFTLLESGYPAATQKAWAMAFTLMFVILAANIGARVWLRRSERKRGL